MEFKCCLLCEVDADFLVFIFICSKKIAALNFSDCLQSDEVQLKVCIFY